jgi:hypothetical protein
VRIAAADRGVRRSRTTALPRTGFVTAVDDGEPAIALAGAAAFEIVIVDLHRRTGGLAVIPHHKQRYGAGVYCAVLSGEDDEATRGLPGRRERTRCSAPFPAVDLRRRLTEVALAVRASTAGDEAPGRLNFLAGSASLLAGNGRHCHTGKGDGGRG